MKWVDGECARCGYKLKVHPNQLKPPSCKGRGACGQRPYAQMIAENIAESSDLAKAAKREGRGRDARETHGS